MDLRQDRVDYAIALGDDSLMLGQRLAEWCSRGPFLEEDIALANVGLDFLGRARMFFTHAAALEGRGRSEDDIAFLRSEREYRNLLLHELPRGDFAYTMVRQFLVDGFDLEFLAGLCLSQDPELAAISAKAMKESHYHWRRSHDWMLRLGDGTAESHARTQDALEKLWGYTHELFTMNPLEQRLSEAGIAVDRAQLRDAWLQRIEPVIAEATLRRPADAWAVRGGRDGVHTEHLGHLLSELQYMQRAYPGLSW